MICCSRFKLDTTCHFGDDLRRPLQWCKNPA